MKRLDRDLSDRKIFAGMGRPALPEGLKYHVLAQARQAVHQRRSLTDSLWESRRLWVAWAAAVVLLIGGQLLLAVSTPSLMEQQAAQPAAAPMASADSDLGPFLARYTIQDSESMPWLGGFQRTVLLTDSFL